MRQLVVKIIMALIPCRKWRQYLQANFDFFDMDIHQIKTKYGKVYEPIYNRYIRIESKEPEIYNADGTPLRIFSCAISNLLILICKFQNILCLIAIILNYGAFLYPQHHATNNGKAR